MKDVLFSAVVLVMGLSVAAQPVAAEVEPVDWPGTAEAPGYDEATAHAPRFDDRAVWPNVKGDEAYVQQDWPEAKLYVWAHPGENGGVGRGAEHDPADPESWLVDGEHPEEVAFGPDVDVMLPDADEHYKVELKDMPECADVRHLTVGRNAHWAQGDTGYGRRVYGNLWVKKGGSSYTGGGNFWVGGEHAFIRVDNGEVMPDLDHERFVTGGYGRPSISVRLGQYLRFEKAEGASVEVLGLADCLDEFRINCTVIVGPDSSLQPGRNAEPVITEAGRLVLMDGAYFGNWVNNMGQADLLVEGGVIQGGTPERPLTRDAHWGLQFKNHTGEQLTEADKYNDSWSTPTVSAVLRPGSVLRSYGEGRLVVRLGDYTFQFANIRNATRSARNTSDLWDSMLEDHGQFQAQHAFYQELPRTISLWFGEGVRIERVRFDHVRPGGLMLEDMADRQAWREVEFGPACEAPPAELFSQHEHVSERGRFEVAESSQR